MGMKYLNKFNEFKLIMILTAVSLLSTACSSIPKKMNQVHPDMPRAEVVKLLGEPDSSGGSTASEMIYYNPVVAFGTHELFFVEFVDARVSRYGSLGRSTAVVPPIQMPMNQVQTYQRPQPAMVNCTSSNIGTTTYTNCR